MNRIHALMLLWCIFFNPVEQNKLLGKQNLESIFVDIYQTSKWNSNHDESQSGVGSTIRCTKVIRSCLPQILTTLQAQSILDIPCGDFNWMRITDLGNVKYIGADIVPSIIQKNQQTYTTNNRTFLHLDATCNPIPKADIILCRDCLAHLSLKNVLLALKNFKRSGATYLLVSSFSKGTLNRDIVDGEWQPLNFFLPPFNFPTPLLDIDEQSPEVPDLTYKKHLVLWNIQELNLESIVI